MVYQGTIQNGVVVFAEGVNLPEGTRVTVVPVNPLGETSSAGATTIWQKMVELSERVEGQPCSLPEDLADNHDHYLHGLPKR